mmetsp:Transcript_37748/g.121133  ORF Transcript_37748/g.121133 Transcript_37748/m.121133 type:complete len:265 (+) Transcript_37748:478-1272(+)
MIYPVYRSRDRVGGRHETKQGKSCPCLLLVLLVLLSFFLALFLVLPFSCMFVSSLLPLLCFFLVGEDEEAHDADEDVLEGGVVVEDDGDHADVPEGADGASEDVVSLEPELSRGVEASVVDAVVVALRQELDGAVNLFVDLHDAVDDGDLAVLDLEDDDLADSDGVVLVVQKKNVAALEGRFHGPAQHYDDGALGLGEEHQPLPDHQRREHDHRQIQTLVHQQPLVLPQLLQLADLRLDHLHRLSRSFGRSLEGRKFPTNNPRV